ncbi:sensor histidine kinase [Marinicrinis sediminis]|uniref:histidine kinase n=1 Tax=Marinicrinis sediminis TaxID=1652465 RepID=A0ABW5RAR1_9BACL
MNKTRRVTLFFHCTRAYFLHLLVGILIITVIAFLWIRHATKEHRLEQMEILANELASQVVNDQGLIVDDREIDQRLKMIQGVLQMHMRLPLVIVNGQRELAFPVHSTSTPDSPVSSPPFPPPGPALHRPAAPHLPPPPAWRDKDPNRPPPFLEAGHSGVSWGPVLLRLLHERPLPADPVTATIKVEPLGSIHIVHVPIFHEQQLAAEMMIGMDNQDATRLELHYPYMISVLVGMLLLGWATIYVVTKRLVRPIEEVAQAANEMKEGRYEIAIDQQMIKEKEVFEMMSAIQSMAEKLKELEALRTLLLAGVSHELKTPIAAISSLVQAVKDDVVQQEEKQEFLQLSIVETERLKRMVEDLLDFNGFATGALKAEIVTMSWTSFVQQVCQQWQMAHKRKQGVTVRSEFTHEVEVRGDPVRTQQMIFNLLNNASQASISDGPLDIRLYIHTDGKAALDVIDQGKGIAPEDLPYIFERFYRGKDKKHMVKGLGLGLPFSLMLANAQGGDLFVKETSASGTVFTLTIPMNGS